MISIPLLRAQLTDCKTFASGYPVDPQNVFTVYGMRDGETTTTYLAINGLGMPVEVDASNIVFAVGSHTDSQHRASPLIAQHRITT